MAITMNLGQSLFTQLMDHLSRHEFRQCVQRYGGNYRVRSFSCWDQFLCMAFAQLTFRESLRDIVACLRSQDRRLYHMGIQGTVSRSTLADANESRDWRIYADFAAVLIEEARRLYRHEDLGLDLANTVYALDSTTIDLCLTLFPLGPLQVDPARPQAAHAARSARLHPQLSSRHGGAGARREYPGRAYARGGCVLRDGPRLSRFPAVVSLDVAWSLLRHPGAQEFPLHPAALASGRQNHRRAVRPNHRPGLVLHRARLSRPAAAHSLLGCRTRPTAGFSDQQFRAARARHRRLVSLPLAGGAVLQMDQTESAHQGLLRDLGERGEDANLDRRLQ